MYILAVAIILQDEPAVKYRLLNVASGQTLEVTEDDLKIAMMNGTIQVYNMWLDGDRLADNTLMGLDRVDDVLPTTHIVTVVYKIEKLGYIISDYTGRMSAVTLDELIGKAECYNGLANGRIVQRKDKTIISSTKGTYPIFKPDKDTADMLKSKMKYIKGLNAKLKLMDYPYKIYGHTTIKLNKTNFERLNIVEPVEYFIPGTFNNCHMLRELKLPPTIKFIETKMFSECRRLRTIYASKNTKIITGKLENERFKINYYD